MKRFHGKVRLEERPGRRRGKPRPCWVVECEPLVAMKLKRAFPRADPDSVGSLVIASNMESDRDLEWFLERYPMELTREAATALKRGAGAHRKMEEQVAAIMSGAPLPAELFGPAGMALQQGSMDLSSLKPREYQQVAAYMLWTVKRMMLADDLGLGKAQPLDARVLTPTGWRLMGDLVVGDTLVDPDGGTANVEAVFPQGEKDIYRVTTEDGASAECCDEHLWHVYTQNDRARGGKGRVLALHDFKDKLRWNYKGKPYGRSYSLPLTEPVDFTPVLLPLPAYLLGVLLGDGHLKPRAVMLSSGDAELRERVAKLLPEGVGLRHASQYDYRISCGNRGGTPNALLDTLRELGLAGKQSWEKRIPDLFLRASVDDRLELLRGLMDTDGTCGKDGTTTFTTTSEIMAAQVRELVQSLGGFASMYSRVTSFTHRGEKKQGRRCYTLNVRMRMCPFHLSRKASRWKPANGPRGIEKVEYVGRKPAQCIRVSSKRSLYVTDGYLVTHNTISALTALNNPVCRPALIVSPTHLVKQWMSQASRWLPHLTVRELKTSSPLNENPARFRGKTVPWPDILITTYGKVAGWAEYLAPHLRTVIAEEAQELRGDPEGRRNQAMAYLCEAVPYTLGLTATPIYNYGGEVYRVLNTLAPGRLGSEEEFAREWCGTRSVAQAKVKDPQLLGQHLRDMGLMLRRTRADVGRELPKQQWVQVAVESDPKVIQQAEGAAAELARIILAQTGYNGMAKLKAAQELDAKIRHATGVAKAPFVAGLVREIVHGRSDGKLEPVILTGWHRDVYAIWLEQLQDLKPVLYTGSESPTEKAAALRRFIQGETPVLILSNRSGAGIDGLQYVCRTIVVGEMDWAHGVHEQIGGRVDRDGQTQPTSVFFPVADAGSDPVMAEVNGVKAAQLQGINNPDREVVEPLEPDEQRMKLLAESLLARHRAAA